MSDHIIRKWRRDCWQEMSAGGMRVGMPHISVLCTDALRTCLEIEHLRAELAERDAEIERMRTDLKKECLLAQERLGQLETATVVIYNERQRNRLPEELVGRMKRAPIMTYGSGALTETSQIFRDILAWHEQQKGEKE